MQLTYLQFSALFFTAIHADLAKIKTQLAKFGYENKIDSYGCWCHFGENYGKGAGNPVDPADRICKSLYDAYTCAKIDLLETDPNSNCNPQEIDYVVDHEFNVGQRLPNDNEIIPGCMFDNMSNFDNSTQKCAAMACIVETTFIKNVISLMTAGETKFHDVGYPENGFRFDSHCGWYNTEASANTDERKCCGGTTNRFPFKPANRECCGVKTFDPSAGFLKVSK